MKINLTEEAREKQRKSNMRVLWGSGIGLFILLLYACSGDGNGWDCGDRGWDHNGNWSHEQFKACDDQFD